MNPKAEERSERVIRKERTLIFNFDTLYNDGYYILLHYMTFYKNKMIPERGVNIPKFTEAELMAYFLSKPQFHALTAFVPIDVETTNPAVMADYYDLSEKLLSYKHIEDKSELFRTLKTFYEIGEVKIIGPKRSMENQKELAFFTDITHEECTLSQLMDPSFIAKKAKEWNASLIIHPYEPSIIAASASLKDCGFMYPIYGYNFNNGSSIDREVHLLDKLNHYRENNGHEFMEYNPFPISLKDAGYGIPDKAEASAIIQALREDAIARGIDPDKIEEETEEGEDE